MTDSDPIKTVLVATLDAARDSVLWKLSGLNDYDLRRPLTPTGTNLLGLLKHLAYVEAGYFGECFGRPSPESIPPWEPPNLDMFADETESTADIYALWERVREHSDRTLAQLPLDTVGHVAWWGPERAHPTLAAVLIHEIGEWNRHLGQIDVLRESVDAVVGYRPGWSGVPDADELDPQEHFDRLQAIAERFRQA